MGHQCKLCGHQGYQENWRPVARTPKLIKTLSSGVCEGCHNARIALRLLLLFSRNARGSTETTANLAKQSHPLYLWQPAPTAMQKLLTAHYLYHVRELYKQTILITIWRCIHARTSPVLTQLLTPAQGNPTGHQQSNGLLSQANRSRCGQWTVSGACDLLWNALPGEVRTIARLPEFKVAGAVQLFWEIFDCIFEFIGKAPSTNVLSCIRYSL